MGKVGMAVQKSIQTRIVGLGIIRYILHPYCYHDRAAKRARKCLLTLLEAETKPLIMALIRIKCGINSKVRDLCSVCHQKRCTELWYRLGRRHNIKYVLKIRIRVRMTTNNSDNISTHVVFRVVELNRYCYMYPQSIKNYPTVIITLY